MKTSHIISILVLVVVVFFATIFLFLYKSFDTGTVNRSGESQNSSTNQNQSTTTPTTTPTTSTTPPSSDTHTALDDCIELKASEANNKNYVRGSLLVSFFNSVDYDMAVEMIRLLGLRAETSSEARSNFNQNHWLTVTVPNGKEFQWQCQLDASEGIKKANLNITFNLRQ